METRWKRMGGRESKTILLISECKPSGRGGNGENERKKVRKGVLTFSEEFHCGLLRQHGGTGNIHANKAG